MRASHVRTPERHQFERTECLATSMGIVLAYHGRHVPPAELREACGAGRDGATVGAAVRAARTHGLDVRALRRGTVEALRALPVPFVAYLDHNHAVVVEGVGDRDVWLNDPTAGRGRLSASAFDARYTGLALTFAPGPGFKPRAEVAPADPLAWTPRERSAAAGVAAASGAAGLAASVTVALLPSAGALGAAVPALAVWLAAGALADALGSRVAARQADLASAHLLARPADDRLARGVGPGARLLADVDGPGALLDALACTLFWGAAGLGGVLAAAWAGHVVLAVVLAVALAAAVAEPWTLPPDERARRSGPHPSPAPDAPRLWSPPDAQVEGGLERRGWVAGLRATIEDANGEAVQTRRDQARTLVRRALAAAGPSVALVTGAGVPLAFLGGAAVVWAPRLAWLWAPFQAFVRRRAAFLDAPPRPPSTPPASAVAPVLTFYDVTFGFAPHGAPLVRDVSFSVRPGEVVAVVGPSGGGKSALVGLAGGLYAPTSGAVRLGGFDVATLPDEGRAAVLGVVGQRPAFWPARVRTLIDLERGAGEGALRDALDASGGAAVSLDQPVRSDGHPLSAGERAAVALARVEVGRPPLVVLDETLDALGPDRARALVARMRAEGRGLLAVTHDESLARLADRVLLLDDGRLTPA